MQFAAIEIALLAGLCYGSWRVYKIGFARVLVGLGARVGASVLVLVAMMLIVPAVEAVTHNFVFRFAGEGLLCAVIYLGLTRLLLRLAARDNHALARWLAGRAPLWVDRVLCGGVVVLLWLSALLTLSVAGEVISVSPWRPAAERHSLLLRYFLEPRASAAITEFSAAERGSASAADLASDSLQEKLDRQRHLLSGFGHGLAALRHSIAQATGTQQLADQIDAIHTITTLPYDDRAWIIRNNPQLLALLTNPSMQRVLQNDHIFDLIDRVSGGSMEAVALLGYEPDIQHLLDDPQVREAIGKIDPADMVVKLRRHQQSHTSPTPVAWRCTRLMELGELDAALAGPAGWDRGHDNQRWADATRFGVLAATLNPAPGGQRLVTIQTAGKPSVRWDGKPVALAELGGNYLGSLPDTAGAARLEIVIDFREVPALPICQVWVAAPD